MNNQEYGFAVSNELNYCLTHIDLSQTERFIADLEQAKAIFVAGAGRSGFMARGFCMRLMHMGLKAYLVGETTTPGIANGDVLVICSGSGETKSLVSMAMKADSLGAKVELITINPESTIGLIATTNVVINAPSPKAAKEGDFKSIQPMGNLFEQSLLLYLDIIIMMLMEKKQMTSEQMFKNHANLE